MSEQELALHAYEIFVYMKPLRFEDQAVQAPDRDMVLEALARHILEGTLDDKFMVKVEEKKEEMGL